jgi:multicomponent Na+:H+ antiporter subunit F
MNEATATMVIGLMTAAAVLSLWRLLAGPSLADRVVAAEFLGAVTTAALALVAGWLGRGIYLDVALVFAALSFVGVVAIARAIEPEEGE